MVRKFKITECKKGIFLNITETKTSNKDDTTVIKKRINITHKPVLILKNEFIIGDEAIKKHYSIDTFSEEECF